MAKQRIGRISIVVLAFGAAGAAGLPLLGLFTTEEIVRQVLPLLTPSGGGGFFVLVGGVLLSLFTYRSMASEDGAGMLTLRHLSTGDAVKSVVAFVCLALLATLITFPIGGLLGAPVGLLYGFLARLAAESLGAGVGLLIFGLLTGLTVGFLVQAKRIGEWMQSGAPAAVPPQPAQPKPPAAHGLAALFNSMDEKGAENFAKLLNQLGDAPAAPAEQPKPAAPPQPRPAPAPAGVHVTPLDAQAVAALLERPHGAVLPASVNVAGRVATAFLFRESQERIEELARAGAFASVHVRSSLLGVGDVQLYVTLIRLGDQVFEIWWNWHNPVIRPLFERLFDQDEVIVAFVSDRPEIARVHRYPSSIRKPLQASRSQLTGAKPWSMEAFDGARAAVEKEYPTPVALWQALGGGS